ncbi:DUF115 domain-containing protein [Treponema sp. TIM-1]|uniref:6-hydroxymethylpterin diphosphokinase MptE-like protein n=1 Tax=Treponema sp. TIM-1 TaxID=2898417 RepID=UPI003980F035
MTGGLPRFPEGPGGGSFFYKGKTLLSRKNSQGQAERLAALFPKSPRTLYFCPSPLYGYGLALLLQSLDTDSAVLCVEADEQLLDLSRAAMEGLLRENPNLRLVSAGDEGELCAYVRQTWGARRFRRVETLRLTGGWQLAPKIYDSLANSLRRNIHIDWGNAMTLVKLGRRYTQNALRNLALIPKTYDLSALSFGNSPVLVLGAGPSLDGLLEGLFRFFGKDLGDPPKRPFRIICVDTCLPPLKTRNIKPDLAVVLESQHWNLRDFIGSGGWQVPAAMDLSALPATGKILGGPVFLFVTPWTELSLFKRLRTAGLLPGTVTPLGSVGLTAAALARRLSSGPIITGGLDFSFTLDAYHARGTPGHLDRLFRLDRFHGLINAGGAFRRGVFKKTAKSGITVRSDPAMASYRDLFEQEFAGEERIRDLMGTGLPLGTLPLSLEKARDLLGAGPNPVCPLPAAPEVDGRKKAVEAFIREEREALFELRKILTGETTVPRKLLEELLDREDYLWAHFPDCAGTGGRRPPAGDISFLKRVRTEIDPFIRLLDRVLGELVTW